jgi:hypothetical protein
MKGLPSAAIVALLRRSGPKNLKLNLVEAAATGLQDPTQVEAFYLYSAISCPVASSVASTAHSRNPGHNRCTRTRSRRMGKSRTSRRRCWIEGVHLVRDSRIPGKYNASRAPWRRPGWRSQYVGLVGLKNVRVVPLGLYAPKVSLWGS